MKNLSDISVIKNLLHRHGFKFSKSLGQNFLINSSVCPEMAQEAGVNKDIGVLEIGPGFGVLTYELAKNAKKVVSIELDNRLIPVLNETLEEFNNVKIIQGDALKLDLNEIIATEFPGMEVVVCANLPYYITSPIIMKLLEEKLPISSITVMIQKEVADRFCAKAGNKNTGAVSIAINYFAEPELLFNVGRESFMPSPNVDSAVIKLNLRETPEVIIQDENLFFKVIKAAFAQRRKTILNCICNGFSIKKDIFLSTLESIGVNPSLRAEQLSMQQFADITNKLNTIL